MHRTLLLLGTNVGNRKEHLLDACEAIQQHIGSAELKSSVYETDAWGKEDQPAFLNQVILVTTTLTPEQVLDEILKIEKQMGRVRGEKWASRIIDIDILFFDNEVIEKNKLKIPHPFLHERKFTLVPLAELVPQFMHPVLGKSMGQLLREVNDPLEVRPYVEPSSSS
ncbi:MAG TPA: 2-amino-4-hydroxy-6-hydroxymethyldihydropteridine diphosphokinase [Bacteroidia bacterium]|nr:2-amino-4-hydroxy-6-hydroxymethyldihydropteridine diphosphokinase [Bacteroidia bacterium]HNP98238.1 2-amino-4-hydroxy-6-hydroxymethyldihydropteridine diphosphokinase [Bacteroidia bacterium]